jgi:hypothetical protein
MSDLEIAKTQLNQKQLTLAIVKKGEMLFKTRSHRISGFLTAVDRFGDELAGASLADRVAGKAVALLSVYAGIKEVYAHVLSKKAKKVFEANGVRVEWNELVDNVLDLRRSDVCPFEKAAENLSDPRKAYSVFKALQDSLKCRD